MYYLKWRWNRVETISFYAYRRNHPFSFEWICSNENRIYFSHLPLSRPPVLFSLCPSLIITILCMLFNDNFYQDYASTVWIVLKYVDLSCAVHICFILCLILIFMTDFFFSDVVSKVLPSLLPLLLLFLLQNMKMMSLIADWQSFNLEQLIKTFNMKWPNDAVKMTRPCAGGDRVKQRIKLIKASRDSGSVMLRNGNQNQHQPPRLYWISLYKLIWCYKTLLRTTLYGRVDINDEHKCTLLSLLSICVRCAAWVPQLNNTKITIKCIIASETAQWYHFASGCKCPI